MGCMLSQILAEHFSLNLKGRKIITMESRLVYYSMYGHVVYVYVCVYICV